MGTLWNWTRPSPSTTLFSKRGTATPWAKFFQEISSISLALQELEELSVNIDRKQQQVLCCTTEESIYKEKQELSQVKDTFTKEAKTIHPKLNSIQESLAKEGAAAHWPSAEIRHNQLLVLIGRYS
uniref:Uncharacterized protein n=1 Tax=Sphaerodactylus townsendi TaxID=933632 RepID=A0ACB8FX39_9SAUR